MALEPALGGEHLLEWGGSGNDRTLHMSSFVSLSCHRVLNGAQERLVQL